MGYQAVTLGETDFTHGVPFARQIVARQPAMFVLANVIDAVTGKPFASSYVIRTVPASRPGGKSKIRVAITGLMGSGPFSMIQSDLKAGAAGIRLSDPVTIARSIVPKLRAQADFVVLLAHMDLNACLDLARAVPGIDLIVVGHAQGTYLDPPPVVNGATLVSNGDRARYGAQALVRLGSLAPLVQIRQVPISADYPENVRLAQLRDAYKVRLSALGGGTITEREMTPMATFFGNLGENRYVGSSACTPCHADAARIWEKSRHSRALLTLQRTAGGVNAQRPDCVRCHTVGFGQPTGYRISAPVSDLAGVGCESCHGPGHLHITRALAGDQRPGMITRSVFTGTKSLCIRCHDTSNDPNFKFDQAVEKIRHWSDRPG